MPKNYLITGAARGIGRGLTRLLLSKGNRVFILDNNDHELNHLSGQLEKWFPLASSNRNKAPENYKLYHCDLSDPSTITQAADQVSTFFNGHLDALINNAAYTSAVGGASIAAPEFPRVWADAVAVNLTAPVLLTRACLPILRKSGSQRLVGGSVVMVSSTRARQSEPDSEAYAATKAGLLGVTHALACSLAGDGVRVNAVLPGWINVVDECKEGDEKGLAWDSGISEEEQVWHWAGRVGRVEDVLKAVEYLCDDGDAGSFITGTEMVVDGGVSRRMVYPE